MTGAGDIYGKSMYDLAVSEKLEDEILTQLKTVADISGQSEFYGREIQIYRNSTETECLSWP